MTIWDKFLKLFKEQPAAPKPGEILIRFVNRYLEPADGITYSVKYEGKELKGKTTKTNNEVSVRPNTTADVRVYAWSRKKGCFKLIEIVRPVINKRQLVYQRMKTYRHVTETQPHPAPKKRSTSGTGPTEKHRRKPPPPGPSPTDNQGVNPKQENDAAGAPISVSERPIPGTITLVQLRNIFPSLDDEFLGKLAKECNQNLAKFKLDTILRRAHFFAQALEEAGPRLKANQESMNYPPAGLKIFRYYRLNPDKAALHGRIDNPASKPGKRLPPIRPANQEAIANHAYAERESNGSIESGDGWRYRGRGIFQLTFRSNYTGFNNEYKNFWSDANPDFIAHPEKVMEYPYTIRSAIYFWVANKIYEVADKGATDDVVKDVTKKINPPAHNLHKRQRNFRELTYPAFK